MKKFKPLTLDSVFPYKYLPRWKGKTLREMVDSAELRDLPHYPGYYLQRVGIFDLLAAIDKYKLNVEPEVKEYAIEVMTELGRKADHMKAEYRKANGLTTTYCRKTFSPEGDMFWDRSHF